MTIESTAALAAELGLLNKDVALTADLLGKLYDGLSKIGSEPVGSEPQADRTQTRQRPLYGLPAQSTALPRRD